MQERPSSTVGFIRSEAPPCGNTVHEASPVVSVPASGHTGHMPGRGTLHRALQTKTVCISQGHRRGHSLSQRATDQLLTVVRTQLLRLCSPTLGEKRNRGEALPSVKWGLHSGQGDDLPGLGPAARGAHESPGQCRQQTRRVQRGTAGWDPILPESQNSQGDRRTSRLLSGEAGTCWLLTRPSIRNPFRRPSGN